MLCVSRAEVEQYLLQNDLAHVEDSSNDSRLPLRNRLRHEVLPLLRRENPNLSETVFRMDAVLRQEDSYLEKQASSLLQSAGHAAFCAPHRRHYRRARCGCFLRS